MYMCGRLPSLCLHQFSARYNQWCKWKTYFSINLSEHRRQQLRPGHKIKTSALPSITVLIGRVYFPPFISFFKKNWFHNLVFHEIFIVILLD